MLIWLGWWSWWLWQLWPPSRISATKQTTSLHWWLHQRCFWVLKFMFENMLLPMHILMSDSLFERLSLSYLIVPTTWALQCFRDSLQLNSFKKTRKKLKKLSKILFSQPELLPGKVPAASRGLAGAIIWKPEGWKCKFPSQCQKIVERDLDRETRLEFFHRKENT